MKTLFTLLFVSVCITLQAQTKTPNYKYLQTAHNAMVGEGLFNELNVLSPQPEISPKEIPGLIEDTLRKGKVTDELALIQKYKSQLIEYFNQIYTFGSAYNHFLRDSGLPFQFASNNGTLTFVQNGLFSNYELNELQLDIDQRAKRVLKNDVLPFLSNLEPLIKVSQIQYFEINIGYKVRDFSNEYDHGRGEQVSIIVPKSVLLLYMQSKISDEQLMRKSAVYNSIPQNRNIRKLDF